MEIIVGNKESLAVGYTISSPKEKEGFIWIYIKNVRYGGDSIEYDIEFFLNRMIEIYNDSNRTLLELFHFNEKEFSDFVECIYDDFEGDICKNYQDKAAYATIVDENIIFRSGCYGFDDLLIGIISDNLNEKIIICKQNSDPIGDSIIIIKGQFGKYLSDLLNLLATTSP